MAIHQYRIEPTGEWPFLSFLSPQPTFVIETQEQGPNALPTKYYY